MIGLGVLFTKLTDFIGASIRLVFERRYMWITRTQQGYDIA